MVLVLVIIIRNTGFKFYSGFIEGLAQKWSWNRFSRLKINSNDRSMKTSEARYIIQFDLTSLIYNPSIYNNIFDCPQI